MNEENTQPVTPKKKPNNKLTVVVIILVALVGILGGFLIYEVALNAKNKENNVEEVDNQNKDQGTEKEEEQDKITELSLDDVVVELLMQRLGTVYMSCERNPLKEKALTGALNGSALSDQEKICATYHAKLFQPEDFVESGSLDQSGQKEYLIKYDTLNSRIQTLFGPTVSVTKNAAYYLDMPSGLDITTASLTYDATNDSYRTTVGAGKGCTTGPGYLDLAYTKLERAYKQDDTLVILEKVIAPYKEDVNQENYDIYTNLTYQTKIAENVSADSFDADQYFDQGSTVTYTFKKDSTGNYYFDHSELK